MATGATGEYPSRAVVVVHGIGEQRRGSTLDSFIRALKRCGAEGGELVQESKPFGESLPPDAIRLQRGGKSVDVYEAYWAPLTANKTSARAVMWWLLRATFIPGSRIQRPSRKTMFDLAMSTLALALAAVVALLALSSIGNLSADVACRTDPEVDCPEIPLDQRVIAGETATWGGMQQFGAIAQALGGSFNFEDRPLEELTPSHAGEVLTKIPLRSWLYMFLIAFVGAQIIYRALQIVSARVQGKERLAAHKFGPQVLTLLVLTLALLLAVQLVAPVLTAFIIVFITVSTGARALRRFLAESLGDVQVYAERDENSEHYKAREAVLAEAEKIFQVVEKRGYQHVVVVAHSLGAVIAFTSLDRLIRRIPPLLGRIDAFITMGAALEKVRYFLERRREADDEASKRLVAPAQAIAKKKAWLNLWYENDLVANPITNFQPEDEAPCNYTWAKKPPLNTLLQQSRDKLVVNLSLGYPVSVIPYLPLPVWTHSRYWGDHEIAQLIADIVLPAAQVPPSA